MKIFYITYKTPKGMMVEGKFIRTLKGFQPIFIEETTVLDKSNEIVNIEEKEI